LLDDHLDYVLGDWLAKKIDIGAFPRELLVLPPQITSGVGMLPSSSSATGSSYSLDSFLRAYASRIAPLLILHHDTMSGALNVLCAALGLDVSSLVKKYFAPCCARFYALYSQSTTGPEGAQVDGGADMVQFYINAATACLEYFKKAMTEKKSVQHMHGRAGWVQNDGSRFRFFSCFLCSGSTRITTAR
jgi:acyl-CoA-binding protein